MLLSFGTMCKVLTLCFSDMQTIACKRSGPACHHPDTSYFSLQPPRTFQCKEQLNAEGDFGPRWRRSYKNDPRTGSLP